jgi:kojibiose phosphorylase
MCGKNGLEQCHTWDIGRSEIHITADVAYSFAAFLNVTADTTLDPRELYLETAKYWESRFSYDAKTDTYHLLFVKGPDEYCGVPNNNAFTVFMARENLKFALLYKDNPKWRDIIGKSVVLYDKDRDLYIQDDNFERLEPFPGRNGTGASYHEFDFDRLQRYKALKQADLVLLMLLLPDQFTDAQKQTIWNYYEPLTLHDSSLSFGTHAYAAAVVGDQDKLGYYLEKSLFLDLEDILHNTGREGIHVGAAGAVWQAVILGIAGLDASGKPKLNPHLPQGWRKMKFKFWAKGKKYRAEINEKNWKVEEIK